MSEHPPKKASLKQATNAVLGLFLVVHSITLAATAWGVPAFVRVATAVNPTRAGALAALAFMLLLVDCVAASRPNQDEGQTFAQNVTSWVTLSWLASQLWKGVYSLPSLGVPAEYLYTPLMSQLSATGYLGVPWSALGHVVGIVSASFFLLSRVGRRFSKRARTAMVAIGVLALVFPLNGLLYVATGSRAFGPSQLVLDTPSPPCGPAR